LGIAFSVTFLASTAFVTHLKANVGDDVDMHTRMFAPLHGIPKEETPSAAL